MSKLYFAVFLVLSTDARFSTRYGKDTSTIKNGKGSASDINFDDDADKKTNGEIGTYTIN